MGTDRAQWLTELYQRHAPALHAYARRRLPSTEEADDVVVEVFATAWRRREQVPREALPWLYATAANVVAHTVRGEVRRRRLGARLAVVRPEPSDDLAEQVTSAVAAARSVAAALQQLPPDDAEVLRLWAWEQLEPSEIAEVLGCSAGAARTRLHRARTRLRSALVDQAGVEER